MSEMKIWYRQDGPGNIPNGFQAHIEPYYEVFDQADEDEIDPKHVFSSVHFGGDINFDNTFINDTNILFRRFSDDLGSGENRFIANSNFNFEIGDHELLANIKVDYLGGSFDRNYVTTDELNNGNFQLGFAPSYQIKQDDLTVNFGASFYYLNDTEASKNKFYIYPKINASYRLVDEVLIAYGGIEGDLIQNSYYSFAQENPFVSPTPVHTKSASSIVLHCMTN